MRPVGRTREAVRQRKSILDTTLTKFFFLGLLYVMHKGVELTDVLKNLQSALANIDLITRPSSASSNRFPEFLVLKLENIKIKMYQEQKHSLPHIHIDYAKRIHVASFSINPATIIDGSIDKKYEKSITDWITTNKGMLLKIWAEAQSGGNPGSLIAELASNNA